MPAQTEYPETTEESQMEKSPLHVLLDGDKYTIKITNGMVINDIQDLPVNTNYSLGSRENLTHQNITVETSPGQSTLYTFEIQGEKIVAIETQHFTSLDKKFNIDNHSVEIVSIEDGETTYTVDNERLTASYNVFIPLEPHTLIKAETAKDSVPHLKVKKTYNL